MKLKLPDKQTRDHRQMKRDIEDLKRDVRSILILVRTQYLYETKARKKKKEMNPHD